MNQAQTLDPTVFSVDTAVPLSYREDKAFNRTIQRTGRKPFYLLNSKNDLVFWKYIKQIKRYGRIHHRVT